MYVVKDLTATVTKFVRPRSHVPVLTGRSNNEVRRDQAVVHAQWSAVDRNSITALFLYRRRKRRHDRLLWVHPIIKKREEFGACSTLFDVFVFIEHSSDPYKWI